MKETQNQMILRFVEENGSITPVEAMAELGVMRLAARISDLEKRGHRFAHQMVESRNRQGKQVHYMRYKVATV